MNSESAVNYQYDELLLPNTSNLLFNEDFTEEVTFRDLLSDRVPSLSTDPPEDSFTIERFETPIQNNKERNRKPRIKDKALRAKTKCPEKKKLIRKEPISNENPSLAVRNRLSAQRSRERKREELNTLVQRNEVLTKEKEQTEKKLALANAELEAIRATVDKLSLESKAEFNSIHFGLNKAPTPGKTRKRNSPLVLAAASLLSCICIVCCFVPSIFTEDTISSPKNRFLYEPTPSLQSVSDDQITGDAGIIQCRSTYNFRYQQLSYLSSDEDIYCDEKEFITKKYSHLYLAMPVVILTLCFLIGR